MALDHFVSQVHLRKFYAAALDQRKLFAWRKSSLKTFICDARDVCRIPEGSTNLYISEPRALEEFLRLVEPRYNRACAAAQNGRLEFEDVFSLAGFTAFVGACSPTAVRIGRESITALVDTQARVMDENGAFDRAPAELGGKTLTELLDGEAISINVDQKFAQSVGIAQILELTNGFADTAWEFILNPFDDSPFLTSDFPVTLVPKPGEIALRRFIPLQPNLGAYVTPSRTASDKKPSKFANFRSRTRAAKRTEIERLNRTIVRCAEDFVFGSLSSDWISRLVERNSTYLVQNTTGRKRTKGGYYTFTSLGVRKGGNAYSV